MFAIQYYNEHAFDNAGCCEIYGPFQDMDTAKTQLAKLVESIGDELFEIDHDDGTYAGYCYETLEKSGRNTDLCVEIWAEIVELTQL